MSTPTDKLPVIEREFRRLEPVLTSLARGMIGKGSKIKVIPNYQSTETKTDGDKYILIAPPRRLGQPHEHTRSVCGMRHEVTKLQLCPECSRLESILWMLMHEIGHKTQGSFESLGTHSVRDRLPETSWLSDEERMKLETIWLNPFAHGVKNIMYIGRYAGKYMEHFLMAAEDIRMESAVGRVHPAAGEMMEAAYLNVIRAGETPSTDGGDSFEDDFGLEPWTTRPLNTQVLMAMVFQNHTSVDLAAYFHPKVVAAMVDPKVASLARGMAEQWSTSDLFKHILPLYGRLIELGFFEQPPAPEPPEADTEPHPENEDSPDVQLPSDPSPERPEPGTGETERAEQPPSSGDPADDEGGSVSDDPGGDGSAAPDGEAPGSRGAGTEGDDSPDVPGDDDDDGRDESESGSGTAGSPGGDSESGGKASGGPDGSDSPGTSSGSSDATGESDDSSAVPGPSGPDSSNGEGGSDVAPEEHGGGDGDPDRSGDRSSPAPMGNDSAEPEEGDASDDDLADSEPEGSDEHSVPGTGNVDGLPEGPSGTPDAPSPGGAPGEGTEGPVPDEVEGTGGGQGVADSYTPEEGTPEEVAGEFAKFLKHAEHDHEQVDRASDGMGEYLSKAEGETALAEVQRAPEFDMGSPTNCGLARYAYAHGDWHLAGRSESLTDYTRYARGRIGDFIAPYQSNTDLIRKADAARTIEDKINYYRPEEATIGAESLRLRALLEKNNRSGYQNNLKSGKIRTSVLANRIAAKDDRIFRTKSLPAKRDYLVIMSVDCSASTGGGELDSEKRAVFAQAEMLYRLSIPFVIFGHSGGADKLSVGSETKWYLRVFEVKSEKEPWNAITQERLIMLPSDSANLDGHALQVSLDLCRKSRASDKIIMYYSDGSMPCEDHRTELNTLKRGILEAARSKITLMGVGIGTDAPRHHGLDTVVIDTGHDIRPVITHLGKRLGTV